MFSVKKNYCLTSQSNSIQAKIFLLLLKHNFTLDIEHSFGFSI